MDINIQQLVFNNNSKTALETYAPLIVGIMSAFLGVIVAFIPYLTEKGRTRKQIIAQKEIEDLTNFKALLHSYYFKILKYYYKKIEKAEERDKIENEIKLLSLNFNAQICLISHYFSETENNKIINIAQKLQMQEMDTYYALRGEEKFYTKSYDYDENKRLFEEALNIISKKIHNS